MIIQFLNFHRNLPTKHQHQHCPLLTSVVQRKVNREWCHYNRYYVFLWSYSCIDGFSRCIKLWLRCSYSNHAPGLIASYFVHCTSSVGGFPHKLHNDCGTENVLIAAIQQWATGNSDSRVYGTSPSNQRIESWWSFFRRSHSQGWIDVFESMVASSVFQPGHVKQTDCLRFCFMHLVQQDLDKSGKGVEHPLHTPYLGARCPAGIPDELYFLPAASFRNCPIPYRVLCPRKCVTSCSIVVHVRTKHLLRIYCISSSFMAGLLCSMCRKYTSCIPVC